MNWSMDTHKFMSEITRRALQILVDRNVTPESEPEVIEAAERELASAGIYKDYDSSKGRIRRALFTYFKAYNCMDDNGHLTEIGKLFAENKITVQDFCFYYVLNYKSKDTDYYPLQLILACLKKLNNRDTNQAFISAYDFSKLVECESLEDVDDIFVDNLIEAHLGKPIEVNERNIGFDVWSYMLINSGIFEKNASKALVAKDNVLCDWILSAFSRQQNNAIGKLLSGVFEYLPTPNLLHPGGDVSKFANEGRALQAYLFSDELSKELIGKYVFTGSSRDFENMLGILGLQESAGFYKHFYGHEHLIGFCLRESEISNIQIIGEMLAGVELTETELNDDFLSNSNLYIENLVEERTYSAKELGDVLSAMYETASDKTTGIHLFGIKYSEIIDSQRISVDNIIKESGISPTYNTEVAKGKRIYKALERGEFGFKIINKYIQRESNYPLNLIFFGAPGTGKSYELENKKNAILLHGGNYERVTFHPDYSYANFVGTYKPIPNGNSVTYQFVPGPFIRTLVNAINNPDVSQLLIIEEINRANVAAVFGDVFQLLDRKNGVSEYPVNPSEDLRDFLALPKEKGGIGKRVNEIQIPSNMLIWATMNSADQGVFPMDTAFKRRWDFKYLGIDEGENDANIKAALKGANYVKWHIEGDELKPQNWYKVRKAINRRLMALGINEDKLIGPFFISLEKLNAEDFDGVFKDKVLMYLYEDAGKAKRNTLFAKSEQTGTTITYSEMIDLYDKEGIEKIIPGISPESILD